MRTTPVIVAHNADTRLRRRIRDLLRHMPDGTDVLVIDDASTDACSEMLKKPCCGGPRLHVMMNPERVGFADSCDIGFEAASKGLADGDVIVCADGAHKWSWKEITGLSE